MWNASDRCSPLGTQVGVLEATLEVCPNDSCKDVNCLSRTFQCACRAACPRYVRLTTIGSSALIEACHFEFRIEFRVVRASTKLRERSYLS